MTFPKHLYLEVSKFKADNGQLAGRVPGEISLHVGTGTLGKSHQGNPHTVHRLQRRPKSGSLDHAEARQNQTGG
jgi:hypothetical protein